MVKTLLSLRSELPVQRKFQVTITLRPPRVSKKWGLAHSFFPGLPMARSDAIKEKREVLWEILTKASRSEGKTRPESFLCLETGEEIPIFVENETAMCFVYDGEKYRATRTDRDLQFHVGIPK